MSDVQLGRDLHHRAGSLSQTHAVAVLCASWRWTCNIAGDFVGSTRGTRAGSILYFHGSRNVHRHRGAIKGGGYGQFGVPPLVEDGLQADTIYRQVDGLFAGNHQLGWIFSRTQKLDVKASQIAR